jgi:hypothetical protein
VKRDNQRSVITVQAVEELRDACVDEGFCPSCRGCGVGWFTRFVCDRLFPEFDYVATCKTDQPDAAGTGETLSKCTGEERQAKQQLARAWSQFASDEKAQCIKETNIDGTPSYVELQICLQMASDVRARVRSGQGHLNPE